MSIKGTLHVFVEPRYTLNLQGPIEYEIACCVENTQGPIARSILSEDCVARFPPYFAQKTKKKRTLSVSSGTIIWTTSWTDFPPKVEHHMSITGIWETQVVNALLDGNKEHFPLPC